MPEPEPKSRPAQLAQAATAVPAARVIAAPVAKVVATAVAAPAAKAVAAPIAPAPKRGWFRAAVVVPVAASMVVHAAGLYVINRVRFDPPRQIVDAPTDEGALTSLALPTPVPPPAPIPPVPAAEPVPASVPVASVTPAEPPIAPPAPTIIPAQAVTVSPLKEEQSPAAAPPARVAERAPTPEVPPQPRAMPASIAGVAADRAERLVYAIDASGAMTTTLPYVKDQLLESVSRLDASQKFQVLVFRQLPGSTKTEIKRFDDASFVSANPQSKARLGAWLADIQPRGRSQPLAGLRESLGLHPDLIFLLTRSIRRSGQDSSWGEGTKATLTELESLNPLGSEGKRVAVIKALQFIDNDPTGMLQEIAARHGDGPGSYRVIVP
jgi:hypothetical protein